MLTPAIAVLVVLYLGALVMAGLQSFGYAPLYGINKFPTLQYYRELFETPNFWWSLFYTFYYALMPAGIATALGTYLALCLHRRFHGRKLFQLVYKLPLMVPYLVGIGLASVLFSSGGILARAAYALGLIRSTGDFPRLLNSHAGWGIMWVYVWKQTPFMAMVIFSVLLGVGRDTEEAALMLGANRRQVFWHVTLPQIIPGIVSASLIVFAFNFGSFEAPILLGAGYPNTLPVEAWRAFDDPDYARRLSSMAIVTFVALVSGAVLFAYISLYRKFERRRGRV
jgi:putative spermidine/putrescine transport system permease protein